MKTPETHPLNTTITNNKAPPTSSPPASRPLDPSEDCTLSKAYSLLLSISGGDHQKLARCLDRDNRPVALNRSLYRWASNSLKGFPLQEGWKNSSSTPSTSSPSQTGDVLPGESFVSG